jgi:hypothetical protein
MRRRQEDPEISPASDRLSSFPECCQSRKQLVIPIRRFRIGHLHGDTCRTIEGGVVPTSENKAMDSEDVQWLLERKQR